MCIRDSYCPASEMISRIPCPVGTFSNSTGITNISDCNPCTKGMYCNSLSLTKPAGWCEAGYLCVSGSSSPSPRDGINEPCPAGFFCERGATYPEPCPTGTMSPYIDLIPIGVDLSLVLLQWFKNSTALDISRVIVPAVGLGSIDECMSCIGGFYCQLLNSTLPTGPCYEGYYCPHNASIIQPTPDEYQCPLGPVSYTHLTLPTIYSV